MVNDLRQCLGPSPPGLGALAGAGARGCTGAGAGAAGGPGLSHWVTLEMLLWKYDLPVPASVYLRDGGYGYGIGRDLAPYSATPSC